MAAAFGRGIVFAAITILLGHLYQVGTKLHHLTWWRQGLILAAWLLLSVVIYVVLRASIRWLDGMFSERLSSTADGVIQLLFGGGLLAVFLVVLNTGKPASASDPAADMTSAGGLAAFSDQPLKALGIIVHPFPSVEPDNIPLTEVVLLPSPLRAPLRVILVGSGGLSFSKAWVEPFTNQDDVPMLTPRLPVVSGATLLPVLSGQASWPTFAFPAPGGGTYNVGQSWYDPATAEAVTVTVPAGAPNFTVVLRTTNAITHTIGTAFAGKIGSVGCANNLAATLAANGDAKSAETLGTGRWYVPQNCDVQIDYGEVPADVHLSETEPTSKNDYLLWEATSDTAHPDPHLQESALTKDPVSFTLQLPQHAGSGLSRDGWLGVIAAAALSCLFIGFGGLWAQRYGKGGGPGQALAAAAEAHQQRIQELRTEPPRNSDEAESGTEKLVVVRYQHQSRRRLVRRIDPGDGTEPDEPLWTTEIDPK